MHNPIISAFRVNERSRAAGEYSTAEKFRTLLLSLERLYSNSSTGSAALAGCTGKSVADSCSHRPSAVTQHLASFPKTASEHLWNSHKPSFISSASCSSSALTVSYAIPLSVCSSSSRSQSQPLVTPPEQPTEISFDFSEGNL